MRLLHTSDWHVGRTFHGSDTVDALAEVLRELARLVREHRIDAVLVAGDVYDSAMPAGRHVDALTAALADIRAAGAAIVLSSGNHDSAARLGANAGFARAGGLHLSTRALEPESWRVELADEHGPVQVFAVPYLEPVALRASLPEAGIGSQADAMRWAMDAVRASRADHPGRAVVLAHCFAAGIAEPEDDAPRDITAGGLDVVPLTLLDGVDYVALGHIHSRQTLSPAVRYSGAPLHYSFRERSPERGGWLVDLDAAGLASVEWLSLTVPRELSTIRGDLDDLLADASLAGSESHWVRALLTDRLRPVDAMRRLKERWPHAAEVQWLGGEDAPTLDLRARLAKRSGAAVVDDFLVHVRSGVGANEPEAAILREALARASAAEVAQ
ncbi:exonuclease SbcCD subunit D [Agrococcus sp. Ld7]|uniref:exonuclease SbcCD subunit D n=1 Tax=Agrococcus sp. Ld7 TaxID=649148 RepID=UPI003869AE81